MDRRPFLAFAALACVAACSASGATTDTGEPTSGAGGTGGSATPDGSTPGKGGSAGTGGKSANGGGTGTGEKSGSGGNTGTGGGTSTGGGTGTGGNAGTGGNPGTGGSTSTGGGTGTGGSGGTSVVDGGPNAASLACDGSGQALIAEASDLYLSGDWTLEAWFKDEDPSGFNHDQRFILSKSGEQEVPYFLRVSYNNLEAGHKANWAQQIVNTALGSYAASAWHHAAATYESSTRIVRIYVDGQLKTDPASASSVLAAQVGSPDTAHPRTLTLCSYWAAFTPYVPGSYWHGKVDDVRVWSVRRTDQQVADNYAAELSGAQTGLVAYYTFDEGSGTVAHDGSGKGHDATLEAGTSFSTDVHP